MISRRTVIMATTALPFVHLPVRAWADDASQKSLFLLLDATAQDLRINDIRPVVSAFVAAGISVSVVLPALSDAGPSAARSDAIYRFAAERALAEPGLVDIVVGLPEITATRRYEVLRALTEARRGMVGIWGMPAPPVIATWQPATYPKVDPYAMRSAGFRVRFTLPETGGASGLVPQSSIAAPDWGQLELAGGAAVTLGADAGKILGDMDAAVGDQVLMISLRPGDTVPQAARWIDHLQQAVWDGRIFTTRSSDYILQVRPGASKLIGLLMDARGHAAQTASMAAFMQDLDRSNFAFGRLADGSAAIKGDCIPIADDGPDAPSDCVLLSDDTALAGDSLGRIVLQPSHLATGWSGPDENGRFVVPLARFHPAQFLRSLDADPMTDAVVLVSADDVATPLQRQSLLAQFQLARQDGLAQFHGVTDYVDAHLAPDEILARYWSDRRRKTQGMSAPTVMGTGDRAAYLDDAAWAWRYLDETAHRATGVCAGTRQGGASVTLNRDVTFWDVASQIQGTIAAQELGLVAREDAQGRIGLVLGNLPTTAIEGLSLPTALFDSGTLAIVNAGFDSCDVGRFLLSLKCAVDAGLLTPDQAKTVVGRWDLPATIKDGRAFGYASGQWRDVTLSHCTAYARQGYAAWGMPMTDPMPAVDEKSTADHYLRLLYMADDVGHYGTEPYLLEAIEGRLSAQSRYLADILFDAQLSWFEDTGRFKCISEAPLNFAPWFSFQGLRLGREGESAWVVSSRSRDPRHSSPAFLRRAAVISAKSAYLWSAVYPHAYSDTLVGVIRENGRSDGGGFCVGLFESDLSAMRDYSDLNTNGIILQAIAHKFRDRS